MRQSPPREYNNLHIPERSPVSGNPPQNSELIPVYLVTMLIYPKSAILWTPPITYSYTNFYYCQQFGLYVFVTSTVSDFFYPTLGTKSIVDVANSPHLDGDFDAIAEVHDPPFLKPTVYVTVTVVWCL